MPSIPNFQSAIRRTLRLRYSLRGLTLFGFAWGVAVLVLRAASPLPRPAMLWGAVGLLPVLLAAWLTARRRTPSARAVRSLLDHHGRCGGLLIAGGETDLGAWAASIPAVAPPRVRWDAGRSWALLGLAAGFVAVTFALPQRMVRPVAHNVNLTQPAERIAHQLETLKQDPRIDPQQVEQLQQQLQQLQQQTAEDPARSWEALDQIKDAATRLAEESAEKSVAANQKLAQAQSLADALQQSATDPAAQPDPRATAEALAQLGDMLRQLKAQDPKLDQALSDAGADAQQLARTAHRLRQMLISRALDKARLQQLRDRLDQLHIDPRHLGLLDRDAIDQLKRAIQDRRLDEALAGELAKALKDLERGDAPPLTPEQVQQLQKALEDLGISPEDYALLNEQQSDRPASPEQLAKLTPEQRQNLRRISGACQSGRQANRDSLQKMIDEGLIDPSRLAQADAAEAESAAPLPRPGNGGIDRGRGDAPLILTDPSSESGMKFKEQTLPPGDLNLQESKLVGVTAGAPKLAAPTGPDATRSLDATRSGGGSANTQQILPRHRAAVESYFQRSTQ